MNFMNLEQKNVLFKNYINTLGNSQVQDISVILKFDDEISPRLRRIIQ